MWRKESIGAADPQQFSLDHVAQIIRRDLIRQAELMLVDIPEEIQIGNVELADLKPVKVVCGRYNLSASVQFSMSHKLAAMGCRTSRIAWLWSHLSDLVKTMTASELLCRQAGLRPEGLSQATTETCVLCGRMINPGEQRSKFRPLPTFMDAPGLCARDKSNEICGYCVHLTKETVMRKTQLACITRKQLIPAAKLAHKKWLLLNPPEPPFVFLQTQTKLSHMIWRTPLTFHNSFGMFASGARQLTVCLPSGGKGD